MSDVSRSNGPSKVVAIGQPVAGARRRRFALTGRSVPLDPVHDAVRADLADVAMADRHFAPHYAAPMLRSCAVPDAPISALPGGAGDVRGTLLFGEAFAVLDLSGEDAWGYRLTDNRVGYVPAAALAAPIAPSHRAGPHGAALRRAPDAAAPLLHQLPPAALVMGAANGAWLETSWGHISLDELEELSSTDAN